MAKPMLVSLAFLLVLLDYWPLERFQPHTTNSNAKTLLRLCAEKLPFFALPAVSCGITYVVQHRAGAVAETLPLMARVQSAVVAYGRYLGEPFWPVDLCVAYPHPDYWPWPIALAVAQWRRRPYFLGWLCGTSELSCR